MKMISILFLFLFMPATTNVSMSGIRVNDPASEMSKLTLKLDAEDKEVGARRYKTASGNDLSITVQNGKVVFMENDWSGEQAASRSLLGSLAFGRTTLAEIRERFGTNGFTYKARAFSSQDNMLIMFNCFELNSPNNEILTIVTAVEKTDDIKVDNIATRAVLIAVILAREDYLDKVWGTDKTYDPNRLKVAMSKL